MYFKRKVHCLVAFIMSALLCVTVLSACNQTEQVQSKDTTLTSSTASATAATQETNLQTTTEETTISETPITSKLDPVSDDMPQIVFVMSARYYDQNISGFYITNTGEIKMYDFRNIAPDEIYDIPDVYDRLEEVTCSEIDYDFGNSSSEIKTEEDLDVLTKDELLEFYSDLLLINGTINYTEYDASIDSETGHYRWYGVRYNNSREKEIILLNGYGRDYKYSNSDSRALDLWGNVAYKFPDVPAFID